MRFFTVNLPLLLAMSCAAPAALLQDPEILIDSGGDAIPITTGIIQVQPDQNCPVVNGLIQCQFDFVNDSHNIVTSFIFQTTIRQGLSPQASASFTCADPGGYFLGCTVFYDPGTGNLRYTYSGVNPADNDEDGSDPETGEMEGIPPNGNFIITLRGWSPNAMVGTEQLYNGLPHLDNNFATTPEPSAALLLATGLLLLAGSRFLRRRAAR